MLYMAEIMTIAVFTRSTPNMFLGNHNPAETVNNLTRRLRC